MSSAEKRKALELLEAPRIDGLRFRMFDRDEDYRAMSDVINRSFAADGVVFAESPDDIEHRFRHPVNTDLTKDLLLAELDGELVGLSHVTSRRILGGVMLYCFHVYLSPDGRLQGVRNAMFLWSERRARELARTCPRDCRPLIEVWTHSESNDWRDMVLSGGYEESWHLFEMMRPKLTDIPTCPLPSGIEIRPGRKDVMRAVWDANGEAFRDDRNYSEESWSEEAFNRFISNPLLRPELWQIAWAGAEVAGAVGIVVIEEENRTLNRRRGWTEPVFVRRKWRGMGVAKALIAAALHALKQESMTEAGLNVDTDNPSGALRLYESMGYRKAYEFTFYRKPVA